MDTATMIANFQNGCAIMLLGMGVVFAFLVLMVWVMDITAKVIQVLNKYFPEEIPQPKNAKKKKSKSDEDEQIAIAIAATLAATQKA